MSVIADHLRFFRALAARPRNVGAVAPSGPGLARAMAAQIPAALLEQGRVLELGPGTGCITEAILGRVAPERLTAVEYDGEFAAALKARFPAVTVIQGDAFDLDASLNETAKAPCAAVLSGLPLLNFPMAARHRLVEGALARLLPGGVFIQFSYGLHAPVVPPDGYAVAQAAFVWINLPPARVWVYRRA